MGGVKISRRGLLGASISVGGVASSVLAQGQTVVAPYRPSKQPFDISALPMLDEKQAGHIRHIQNVSKNLPNTWIHMKGPIDHMGGGTGPALYKVVPHTHFGLMMAYANRLPAAPGVFRATSHRLITQALDKEVWGYWALMSTSGKQYDPALKEPRKPWPDPVVKENIMYSARLAMMLGFHSVLFNDNIYEKPDSVVLDWDVPFSGGPAKFSYSLSSLSDRMYWQLVESGHIGFPCEPNCVFVVCNQYGLIAQRLNDIRAGTKRADESVAGFMKAWNERGLHDDDGQMAALYRPNQDAVIPLRSPMWSMYAGTYMSAWNMELVKANYPNWTKHAWRKGPDGTISPWPSSLLSKVKAAAQSGASTADLDVRQADIRGMTEIGQMAVCAAEVGDKSTLDGLLAHADMFNKPTWENGGFFYPRNDVDWDDKGNMTKMDPWTGTGGLAHARLTVEGGLSNVWNKPWGTEHFNNPALDEVSEDLDVLRAVYVSERKALVWTARTWHGRQSPASFTVSNIKRPGASWKLFRDGQIIASGDGGSVASGTGVRVVSDRLQITTPVRSSSDFVLVWA